MPGKVLFVTVAFFLTQCKSIPVEYKISDSYVGPSVVFIYPNSANFINEDDIVVKDGLGVIKESEVKRKFIFKSIEKGAELQIIAIGDENQTTDNERHIFQLTKGSSSSNCSSKDLNLITFFVGNKADFTKWTEQGKDELSFFDSIGVKWCDYYKQYKP
jgi:hypothetical protein